MAELFSLPLPLTSRQVVAAVVVAEAALAEEVVVAAVSFFMFVLPVIYWTKVVGVVVI